MRNLRTAVYARHDLHEGLLHSAVTHHLANARFKLGATTTAQLAWILAPRLPEPSEPEAHWRFAEPCRAARPSSVAMAAAPASAHRKIHRALMSRPRRAQSLSMPSRYTFALTHGHSVQWPKDVLAAGGCAIQKRGRSSPLDHPELFVDASGRVVPRPVRIIFRVPPVREYLAMAPSMNRSRERELTNIMTISTGRRR